MRPLLLLFLLPALPAAVPVEVVPVSARHGMVVAGHPDATAAGVAVLRAGGNAIDAAVAVSLSLGVAEPYGSGLGGKLMLLYHEAATGKTYAVDAMDAAPDEFDVAAYLKRPVEDRSYGYGSVCIPGLAEGLWTAHQRWGRLPWAGNVAPAIALAREGFSVLPKTHDLFVEQEPKLRRGDPEIARLYLPEGRAPAVNSRLPNPDLARTLGLLARDGRDGFYKGPVAEALVSASEANGGLLTLQSLADYEARVVEPIGIDFRDYRVLSGPPPTHGAPLVLTLLKALENEAFDAGPLRSAAQLDFIGRLWRDVQPRVQLTIADAPEAWFNFEKMVAPDAIAELRAKAGLSAEPERRVVEWDPSGFSESAQAATTHFIVADRDGNIVCATQSLSLHFGAGVVAPGTGVVLNDSMSNFAYHDATSINYAAPGKRPRSTITPTLVLRDGKAVLAVGIPGASRIPTAVLQVLLDRLVLNRPLAEAIGDTRFHYHSAWRAGDEEAFEAEQSFPADEAARLTALGWKVVLREPAGTGRYFGGINAVETNPAGGYTGYADPRRTNAAAGY
jgi:gamma-glutamyltranspeptidase/glutathione hydrolase